MTNPCPEFGEGYGGVTLTCDLPYQHDGPHHDAATDARWSELDRDSS